MGTKPARGTTPCRVFPIRTHVGCATTEQISVGAGVEIDDPEVITLRGLVSRFPCGSTLEEGGETVRESGEFRFLLKGP